jgi:hypothetical protein
MKLNNVRRIRGRLPTPTRKAAVARASSGNGRSGPQATGAFVLRPYQLALWQNLNGDVSNLGAWGEGDLIGSV